MLLEPSGWARGIPSGVRFLSNISFHPSNSSSEAKPSQRRLQHRWALSDRPEEQSQQGQDEALDFKSLCSKSSVLSTCHCTSCQSDRTLNQGDLNGMEKYHILNLFSTSWAGRFSMFCFFFGLPRCARVDLNSPFFWQYLNSEGSSMESPFLWAVFLEVFAYLHNFYIYSSRFDIPIECLHINLWLSNKKALNNIWGKFKV